jgi:hypothetical protein
MAEPNKHSFRTSAHKSCSLRGRHRQAYPETAGDHDQDGSRELRDVIYVQLGEPGRIRQGGHRVSHVGWLECERRGGTRGKRVLPSAS